MRSANSGAPGWLARTWEYGGVAGALIAIVAAALFAFAVGPWMRTISDSFDVMSRALDAVDSTIEVVDDSLVVFSGTLVGIDGVLEETEATLGDVSGVVLTTGSLLQDEIPGQIESIQSAMDGLIDTANVVDGVLSALSFVGVDYDPVVPLDVALADVNGQLGDLGDSLAGYSADLFSLTVSLNRLNGEVTLVGDSLSGLESQVDESLELIASYRETASTAQQVIAEASDRLIAQVWAVRLLGLALLLLLVPVFGMMWWVGRGLRAETASAS